jgi:hypothetical protein
MWIIVMASLLTVLYGAPTLAGRGIIVDPAWAYYKDRSAQSIAEEIKVNGYDEVHLIRADDELVKTFTEAGLRVWLLTFVNGVYDRQVLPQQWEAWRMKLRKKPDPAGFTMLCPNNPDYRAWKKQNLASTLLSHQFYGIDLAEPQMPAYPGPDSEYYGCFCEHCLDAFKRLYPEVICFPDFDDPKSPYYWKNNPELYAKWVEFRVATVVNWLNDLVNGENGIRRSCPKVKVATWSLGLDVPDQLAKLREWQAMDAAEIVRVVKPDFHVIQTDWPDWIKTELAPDYPKSYKPVFDSICRVAPSLPILLQTDIGSKPNMRRSRDWIANVEETARKLGYAGVFHYEYHLGEYIYSEPPRPIKAFYEGNTVKVLFNKRLDPIKASDTANYSLTSGSVESARVDGNIVYLCVTGVSSGSILTVSGLADDPSRRLFHDRPACAMPGTCEIVVK